MPLPKKPVPVKAKDPSALLWKRSANDPEHAVTVRLLKPRVTNPRKLQVYVVVYDDDGDEVCSHIVENKPDEDSTVVHVDVTQEVWAVRMIDELQLPLSFRLTDHH